MMGNASWIARRVDLPCEVPPGGCAVVLVDGRVASKEPLQGPGHLTAQAWQGEGRRVQALLFPRLDLRLRFHFTDLHPAGDVRPGLSLTLVLRIADPLRFLTNAVQDKDPFTQDDLIALLQDPLRNSLVSALRQRRLEAPEVDEGLRGSLDTAFVEHSLRDDADLAGRLGLEVLGVEVHHLRRPAQEKPGKEEGAGERTKPQPRSSALPVDRPELAGLWRVLCPRCLAPVPGDACPRCGLPRPAEPAAPPLQPCLKLDGRVEDPYGGMTPLGPQICLTIHTGHPKAGRLVLLDRFTLQEQRRATVEWDGRRPLLSPQVAADETYLYAGSAHEDVTVKPAHLLALRRDDLSLAWAYPIDGAYWVGSPALGDGLIFVADSRGYARAVDPLGRREVWSTPLEAPASEQPPAVDRDLVIFPSRGPAVVALDGRTGTPRWPRPYRSDLPGARFPNTPLIAEDRVYVSGWDGCLVCLDRRDGRVIWRYRTESGRALLTPPVRVGSLVLVGGRDRHLHAVRDLGDRCELAWTYFIAAEKHIRSRPLVVEDVVYVAGEDKRLHAVDLQTGRSLWPEPLALGERVRAGLVGNGLQVIVAGVRGSVWAVPCYRPPLPRSARACEQEARWDLAVAAHVRDGNLSRAAELCRERLDLPEAAEALWMAGGAWDRAAAMWERAGQPDRALDVCLQAGSRDALERALILSRKQGAWRQEAEILALLGRHREAGDVLLARAQQRERETQGRAEEELAGLFEQALDAYRKAGLDEGAEPRRLCEQKVRYYRRLPDLQVLLTPADRPFVVGKVSPLRVVVRNVGRGEAKNVHIELKPALAAMQGDLAANVVSIRPRGGEWRPSLNVKPTEAGWVEVQCLLRYEEPTGHIREVRQRWEIEVLDQHAPGPQVIHVHEGGQVIYSGRDTTIVQGDLLEAGAQKGDRVVIGRHAAAGSPGDVLPRCRHCGHPLVAGAAYCEQCGEPVAGGG